MQSFTELDETWQRCLFTESPIPMALVGRNHRFLRLNSAYCALLGYSRSELLARTWQSVTHYDDIDGDNAGAEALQSDRETDTYTISKRYHTKTGDDIWVKLHVRAIWDGPEFICYYIVADPCPPPRVSEPKAEPAGSYLDWIKRHPKDSVLLGTAVVAVFGRDAILELVKHILSK